MTTLTTFKSIVGNRISPEASVGKKVLSTHRHHPVTVTIFEDGTYTAMFEEKRNTLEFKDMHLTDVCLSEYYPLKVLMELGLVFEEKCEDFNSMPEEVQTYQLSSI